MTSNTGLRIASLLPFLTLSACSSEGDPAVANANSDTASTGTTGAPTTTTAGSPTATTATGTTGAATTTTGVADSTTTAGSTTGSGGGTSGGLTGMGGATSMGGAAGTMGTTGAGGASTGGMGGTSSTDGGTTGGGDIWVFEEDPGADCAVPAMPSVASLVADPKLPDPFTKMDGSQMTSKSEWLCRREEILRQGFEFIYGEKPVPPEGSVSGSVSNSSISVQVSDGGGSTSFSVSVSLPSAGSAPYPAVIAYGSNAFSNQLSALGIASITYNVGDVAVESGSGPKSGGFYSVYGSDHEAGMLVAWAWGVSRIIDVLEQDPSVIDPTKIGVTGCSRWGKGAFVAGVLDNRVALTVPVESGVGGTPALRLIGDLDSGGEWPYHAISYVRWFSEVKLGQFATANNAGGDTTDKLPVDMHEFIGLVAPRGLYIVDNPSTNYAGLDRNAAWVTANVGAKIYEALGVPDNITLQGASGGHCQWRTQYTAPLVANLEKFLLGQDSATGTFDTDFSGPNPEGHYDWSVPTLSGDL